MRTMFQPFKTTACRRSAGVFSLILALVVISGCSSSPKQEVEHEEEALARTEFTDRIENFFEYEPLKAAKQSQFLIHLTDLSDGAPIENAEVTLTTRAKGGVEVMQTKARVGKVTGIYVAAVTIPSRGDYEIEFHIKNAKLDERLALTDFKVE